MSRLFRVVYNKWFPPPLPPADSFKDQTILITGATGGLGLEAAIHYVQLGASTVIITARTLSRGPTTKATIEARTGKTGVVQVRELDMSTFAGVKTFVDGLKEEVKTIDVVLLNAGVYKTTLPACWGKQHLGFVSSGLHTMAKIEAEDFPKEDVLRYWSDEKHFLGSGTYALSKLFMIYGAAEIVKLAREEDGSPSPIINTMCPSLCKSDLGRQYTANSMLKSIAVNIFLAALSKSAEAGARTFILAAMTGPEENGKYVKHYGSINVEYQFESAKNMTSETGKKLQEQVWGEMLQIFDAAVPEASKVARSKL